MRPSFSLTPQKLRCGNAGVAGIGARSSSDWTEMLSTSNVAVQFGAKPLFEQVTVKFSDGNRYGLIGANGSGKSTLMKVLGGEIDQSTGDVMLQAGLRMGKLNQNQFAYEDERVLDVVMQGHARTRCHLRERRRHR